MLIVDRYDDDLEEEYINLKSSYRDIVKILEEKTAYIELVNFKFEGGESQYDTEFYNLIKKQIIEVSAVTKWAGTSDGAVDSDMYRITASKELFNFLKNQKFFFRTKKGGFLFDKLESQADIAFYTKDNMCLLYTTTGEGVVGVYDEKIENIAKGN